MCRVTNSWSRILCADTMYFKTPGALRWVRWAPNPSGQHLLRSLCEVPIRTQAYPRPSAPDSRHPAGVCRALRKLCSSVVVSAIGGESDQSGSTGEWGVECSAVPRGREEAGVAEMLAKEQSGGRSLHRIRTHGLEILVKGASPPPGKERGLATPTRASQPRVPPQEVTSTSTFLEILEPCHPSTRPRAVREHHRAVLRATSPSPWPCALACSPGGHVPSALPRAALRVAVGVGSRCSPRPGCRRRPASGGCSRWWRLCRNTLETPTRSSSATAGASSSSGTCGAAACSATSSAAR